MGKKKWFSSLKPGKIDSKNTAFDIKSTAILSFLTLYMSESVFREQMFLNIVNLRFLISFLIFFALFSLILKFVKTYFVGFTLFYFLLFLLSCLSYLKFLSKSMPLHFMDYIYFFTLSDISDSSNIKLSLPMIVFLLIGIAVAVFLKMRRLQVRELFAFEPVRTRLFRVFSSIAILIVFIRLDSFFMPTKLYAGENLAMSELFASAFSNAAIAGSMKNPLSPDPRNGFFEGGDFLDSFMDKLEKKAKMKTGYSGKKPNVVVILSESFFDLASIQELQLSDDPVKNFRELKNEGISGKFLSNTHGGGTSNVEFEVLTGFISRIFPYTDSVSRDFVTEPTLTLASIFKEKGYDTLLIHTYLKDFYERDRLFPLLGFDEFISFESMKDPVYDGNYVSDAEITNIIIDEIESRSEPLFTFAISMENHQPYPLDRYENTNFKVQNSSLPADLIGQVETYAEGISHSDRELMRLLKYLKASDEETVVLFFGDHRPTLGLNYALYKQLGSIAGDEKDRINDFSESELETVLSTEFLLWSNYQNRVAAVDFIGQNFLGNFLLDYIGAEKPLFYHYIDEVYKNVTYFSRVDFFMDSNFGTSKFIPDKYKKQLDLYMGLQYELMLSDSDFAKRLAKIVR